MSKNVLGHFLSLLKSGKLVDLVSKYYDDNVEVVLNKHIWIGRKDMGISLLGQTLNYMQILQFRIEDVRCVKDSLSYKVYSVFRNDENRIYFIEHHIENKWKNDLIYEHNHLIINY
ncbi:hypothetical protein GWK08_04085 [Leptobacterium flavescens]|uniref:Nuclear transport factor 2 family protein n=1 Tax=Leptobacterium flavescens TaxID=472055 RepID=A0A6P0UHX6_9FLAO|nr:hypothetical protein [Leptobacterium flavescens]NER12607.1 hypothetical protein [Leptobacterium flavescens]